MADSRFGGGGTSRTRARFPFVVIGGGITGLAAAIELTNTVPGKDVVVLEGSGRLGGVISTELRKATDENSGCIIEHGPDGVLAHKPQALELIRELGIEHRVVERRSDHPGAYLRQADGLAPLPAGLTGMVPLELERLRDSGILSEAGLARVAEEPNVPPGRASAGTGQDDETVASFFTRRFGRELFEHMVSPLISGVYAGSGEELSMRALFPQLLETEQRYGSVIKGLRARRNAEEHAGRAVKGGFISLAGGMGELVAACRAELLRRGVAVHTGTPVSSVTPAAGGAHRLEVNRSGKFAGAPRELHAEHMVAALPAPSLARLLDVRAARNDGDDYLWTLDNLFSTFDARSSALVTFVLPKGSLAHLPPGAGYVVGSSAGSMSGSDSRVSHILLACTISSRKWPGRAPAGQEIVRFYFRRNREDRVTARERGQLIERAAHECRIVFALPAVDPEQTTVTIWRQASPVYRVGHVEHVASLRTALSGVFPRMAVAGSSFDGVGIPDCIAGGRETAARVLGM